MTSDELLKILVPAGLALIGVLAGLLVGYRRWLQERRDSQNEDYRKERREAYKELLEKLENIHVTVRRFSGSSSRISSLIADVNTHILKSAAYLEDDVRELANRYVESLKELDYIVRNSESEEVIEDWESTAPLPPSVFEVARAEAKTEDIRGRIVDKVRQQL